MSEPATRAAMISGPGGYDQLHAAGQRRLNRLSAALKKNQLDVETVFFVEAAVFGDERVRQSAA